ncbi:MAG: SagB family peptide dehydrogenase [Thermodesulfobacteriota bacterium]
MTTGLDSAAQYHRLTRYSRLSLSGGGLDWSNQPSLYKAYPEAERVDLPRDLVLPKAPAQLILAGRAARSPQPLNLTVLADLLFMAYGFTAKTYHGSEAFLYRSAPSAGALYPVEIYLAARGVTGLADGLYHYSLLDFSLTMLRPGPPPAEINAPALLLTALFFRGAWKYRDRAFRYCLLDAGHTAENLLLAGAALGLNAELRTEFDDAALLDYLGLDGKKEAPLALVGLGESTPPGVSGAEPGPGPPSAADVAPRETVFELISAAAALTAAPLSGGGLTDLCFSRGPEVTLPPPDWEGFEGLSLVQALQRRRSRRNFRPKTLPRSELARALDLIAGPDVGRPVNLGFTSNEVQDLSDGYYLAGRDDDKLRRHKSGFLGPALASAALDQEWLGRANLVLVLTAPLARLEEGLGPRSLRLAYLAAGRLGQRAYLAAEVLDWGCCGVGAFYDDEAVRVLDLPAGEDLLYLLPCGPIQKRTHGGRR